MALRKDITWDELTWEELTYISSREQTDNEEDRWRQRLDVWMILEGLEPATGAGVAVDGDWNTLFQFQKKGDRKGDVFVASAHEMIAAVNSTLKFMDYPVGGTDEKEKRQWGGLTALPREYLRIGRRKFHLPDPLILNLTYQQYTNVQKLTQVVWGLSKQIHDEQEKLVKCDERIQKLTKGKTELKESTQRTVGMIQREAQSIVKSVTDMVKEFTTAKARVVAHLVTGRKLQLVGGTEGNRHIDIKWTWPYDPERAERQLPYIERHAPWWLFEVLQQHLQSCLAVYKEQFPDLFSGTGSGGDDKLPIINEMGSVNAVMKWQGYQEQQSVYDSNAVFIFGILDSMTKEAKAIEEANAKMRVRSKH